MSIGSADLPPSSPAQTAEPAGTLAPTAPPKAEKTDDSESSKPKVAALVSETTQAKPAESEIEAAEAKPETETNEAETPTETEASPEAVAAAPESNDLLTQLENKVSSFWTMASQTSLENQGEGLLELKQEILDQIASAKESITHNESLQLNVQFAENKLKELTERVKTTDVGINFNTVSTQANKALDNLDSKLEIVEQQATKFVSLLTSFFSSMVVVNPPKEEAKESAADRSFSSILSSSYGNTRFDSDLHKLHTTESYYLSADLDNEKELAAFDVNSKTQQISALLEQYPSTLQPVMNKLVPEQLTYATFWYRYFKREQQLKQQEEARKELLSGPKRASAKADASNESVSKAGAEEEDDDDDFTWDDDEDESK